MTRTKLKEKIQQSIFSSASKIMQEKSKQKSYDTPELSSEEIERIVFNGNSFEGIQKKFNLREAIDSLPKVTTAEIKEFENAMEKLVSSIPNTIVSFDTQENGHYMKILMNTQGAEAYASGSLNMADQGSIKWFFSLQNGLKILAEQPVSINEQNKMLFSSLQDFYNGWQKSWRTKLSRSSSEVEDQNGAGDNDSLADTFNDANPQVGAGMAPERA